jgi:hypothetical protein
MAESAITPYPLTVTMRDIQSSASAADGLASGVHAALHGSGSSAELARAIHLLCDAVEKLAAKVERLERELK